MELNKNKKIELLAPAGTMEALRAAVSSGADAVYLGGSRFGARAFAGNFSEGEIIEAVNYCHIRGVRVYVTMNTLIYEDEIEEAIRYLRFLYEQQVDAIIIQDYGLFEIIKQYFPDFEIHCSTQMHIHNHAGVELAGKLGAKRVVLARESSLELIQSCSKLGVDLEVFVHGALCVSYSGQCLMSAFNGGRSANRGECAQPCRLPYKLKNMKTNQQVDTQGEYLLSLKDLYTLQHVPELIKAGIHSFKIEGRMKKPEYVAEVVRLYREAIDFYFEQKHYKVSNENEIGLKKLFHRQFTSGYLMKQPLASMNNALRPNHIGVVAGKVIGLSRGKIKIKLSLPIHQGDGIRILSKKEDFGLMVNRLVLNGNLVSSAVSGDIVEIETSIHFELDIDDQVLLTKDSKQIEQIQSEITHVYRRFGLSVQFNAHVGSLATLILGDGQNEVKCMSTELVAQAQKRPITQQNIIEQLSKLQDTPYCIETCAIQVDDNAFMSLKTINEMRREAISQLNEVRVRAKRHKPSFFERQIKRAPLNKYHIVLSSQNQDFVGSKQVTQYSAIPFSPNIQISANRVNEISTPIESKQAIANQLGDLLQVEDDQIFIAGTSFNITNSYAVRFIERLGVSGVIYSLEMKSYDVKRLVEEYKKRYHDIPQLGCVVYGRREVMIMKYCPISRVLNCTERNCEQCPYPIHRLSQNQKHYYLLNKGPQHHILIEEQPFTEFESNYFDEFKVINFTIEDATDVLNVLKQFNCF